MAPKKEKDIVAPFIQGPSMDWTMDDGLYSRFQTWKISCNLIMDSELCELSEVRKINTLLRWSSDFGIKKLKSWQKEPSQLTLNFIWGEYESYCKLQSNELRAQYDILKKLTQGSLPADDWMTKLQSQLHLCNYKPEMEEVLLRDLFLFGLQDESFMSKIISEESPDVTTAQLRNKLKRFEPARQPPNTSNLVMQRKCIKSKGQRSTKNHGANKAPSLKMTLVKITKVKRTITGNNHRKNISNLPVKQQCQLQRNSFMVMVNKQRRLTQALA